MGDLVVAEAVAGGGRDTPISVEAIARRETALKGMKEGELVMRLVPAAADDSKVWISPDGKVFLAATHAEDGVVISLQNGASCSLKINGSGIYPVGDCSAMKKFYDGVIMRDSYFSARIHEYLGY